MLRIPLSSRALSLVLPLALLLVLLAHLWLRPDADPAPVLARQVEVKSPAEAAAALDGFDSWLAATSYSEAVERGVELARARRVAMKELIQADPQAALARAVPYATRKRLPEPVVALLETPVSTTADLEVEQACGGPGSQSWRRCWVRLGDERLQVFTYGERAEVMTKQRLSVHGIAIDEVMAMSDDPLRELTAEEATDRGVTGRVVQLGRRLFEAASDSALEAARQQLRKTEETLGPEALPAYRDLALGQMEGMYPLAMQDGSGGTGGTADDLPPVAASAWTEGPKTMLYIRARFADDAVGYEPVSLGTAQARQGEAEAFWHENSYGKSTLSTTYTDVVTLPKNGGEYVNNFGTLLADARAAAVAANPAWNHTNFSFYTVITNYATNAQGTGFNYTGIAQLGGPGSHLLRQFISVRTASHEYGHNLGLNHSEYWLTDSPSPIGGDSNPGGYAGDAPDDERIEYGHKFAIMSGQDAAGDFDAGRAHYAASNKNRLDWLLAGDIASTTSSGTFRLYRHDVKSADFGTMTDGVPRAIKIDLPATDPTGFAQPYKYWLNYRLLPTNGIAENWLPHGLQVDWRRDGNGFRAVQLDMTPYSRDTGPYGANPGPYADNDDKEDGVLLIGRTFSDSAADIHFTPVAKGGSNPNEWLDVVVNIGTQGSNAPPQIQSFTVSNATPGTGDLVNLAVTATDPNGDTLAYHWDLDDGTVQSGQLNRATRAKIWNNAGFYVARVEVSDMKGGKASASALIQVGSPSDTGKIYGRVTHAGRPVEGALIRGGGADAWTESDGSYVLAGLPVGSVTVTAVKDGLSLTEQFRNPVQVTEYDAFGIDFTATEPWTGGGGTVAIIRPYQLMVPLGFAAQFTAQAFDGSGNPIAFNPAWSVSGGGVIGSSGVFQAQSLGGPFVVTAQSGGVTATAEVTVVAYDATGAASGTWINGAGGSWNAGANWAGGPPGIIASGPGFTADFSTLNLTADATVNLDVPRTIGSLIFGDTNPTASAAGWVLANGSGGRLTLAGATPTITVNTLGAGKFASITALLNGLNGFTKNGAGNLLLNNAGNPISGAVVLAGGNLQLNSASLSNTSSVALNQGTLVLATTASNAMGGTISFGGGTLQYNSNPGTDYSSQFSTAANQNFRISITSGRLVTFSTSLTSVGGMLTKLNAGTLTLAAANAYDGGTTLSGGILNVGHASALGAGTLSFSGNSTLQAGGAYTLANAVTIVTGVTGIVDTNGNDTTLSGVITGGGNLTKIGTGILNIAGGAAGNTLSGTINVNEGTLSIDNVTPNPGIQSFANMNGVITVASGACFNFSQSFTTANLDNDITLSGSGTGGLGALNLWRNATATGTITLANDATISHTFNRAIINGTITGTDRSLTLTTLNDNQPGLEINGPVQLGTGGITVNGAANNFAGGDFSVKLSGNISYSGETHVVTGKLMLSGAARLHDASTVRVANGAVLQLDFAGVDTVGALFLGGVAMPVGTYGSLTSAAANKSAYFEGNGILYVGVPANDYAFWAISQVPPVTGGPDGDDDNNGVKNLLQYALADGGERGVLSGTTITFTKRGAPYGSNLTYIIETSETLEPNSWSAAVTHGPAELGSDISYTFVPTPPYRKFARLKVVQTP